MSAVRAAASWCAVALAMALGLASSAGAEQPTAAPSAAAALPLEPKAIEILQASSRRLAAARTMSFTAVVSYESPSRLGPALVYSTHASSAYYPPPPAAYYPYHPPTTVNYYGSSCGLEPEQHAGRGVLPFHEEGGIATQGDRERNRSC